MKQHHENNSARRTYNLLHFSLPRLEPNTSLVEDELVASCSASRNTVRTVLRRLADEGLVSRRVKVGTIAPKWVVLPIDEVRNLDELGSATSTLSSDVLEALVIKAPTMVRGLLELPSDSLVLVIEGMLYLTEERLPVALTVNYISIDRADQASPLPEDADPIAFLEDELGVNLGPSTSTLGAMAAGPFTAKALGIREGAAMVWIEEVLRDSTGRPRALSQHRVRADRVAFSSSVSRGLPARLVTPLSQAD